MDRQELIDFLTWAREEGDHGRNDLNIMEYQWVDGEWEARIADDDTIADAVDRYIRRTIGREVIAERAGVLDILDAHDTQ